VVGLGAGGGCPLNPVSIGLACIRLRFSNMVSVFFSVDVEVWCDGWSGIDAKFPRAFQQYVYGSTANGGFGLPFQLRLLSDHGLKGTFFVEPLFAGRFGLQPLREIVGLVRDAGHEVQLHMHTEWVDESHTPWLGSSTSKRQFLSQFDVHEQTRLLAVGIDLLRQAGVDELQAFRAGSFAFNAETLTSVAANGLRFDASYNPLLFGRESGVGDGRMLLDVTSIGALHEVPMTVFRDGTHRLRHAQLGACSFEELRAALEDAERAGRESFMMLSHSFELLSPGKDREDRIVVDRMRKLCAFLERHRDRFKTTGFSEFEPNPVPTAAVPIHTPLWPTIRRLGEQALRRGGL
jgi:hypothetical protein